MTTNPKPTRGRPSQRQLELLAAIRANPRADWGELFTCWWGGSHTPLDFRNFDRVADAVQHKGLVEVVDATGSIGLTAAGLATLETTNATK